MAYTSASMLWGRAVTCDKIMSARASGWVVPNQTALPYTITEGSLDSATLSPLPHAVRLFRNVVKIC